MFSAISQEFLEKLSSRFDKHVIFGADQFLFRHRRYVNTRPSSLQCVSQGIEFSESSFAFEMTFLINTLYSILNYTLTEAIDNLWIGDHEILHPWIYNFLCSLENLVVHILIINVERSLFRLIPFNFS